jgi:fibronectin type 3 domain-containing protein
MKNVFKLIGVIAIVAVVGFSMAACGGGGGKVLPAPTGLTAKAASATSINVSWNHVSGASEYYLYYSKSQSTGYELLAKGNGNSYSAIGLAARTLYYFKIAAVAADGNVGATSSAVSARTY